MQQTRPLGRSEARRRDWFTPNRGPVSIIADLATDYDLTAAGNRRTTGPKARRAARWPRLAPRTSAEHPNDVVARSLTTATERRHHHDLQRGIDTVPSSSTRIGRFGRMFRTLPIFGAGRPRGAVRTARRQPLFPRPEEYTLSSEGRARNSCVDGSSRSRGDASSLGGRSTMAQSKGSRGQVQ